MPFPIQNRPAATTPVNTAEKNVKISNVVDPNLGPVKGVVIEELPADLFGLEGDKRTLNGPAVRVLSTPMDNYEMVRDHQGGGGLSRKLRPGIDSGYTVPVATERNDFAYLPDPNASSEKFKLKRNEDGTVFKTPIGGVAWAPERNSPEIASSLFYALNKTKITSEIFAERELRWGINGQMTVVLDGFPELNAYFNPVGKNQKYGTFAYRDLKEVEYAEKQGKDPSQTPLYVMRMASIPDVTRHESGHALHRVIKPNEKGYLAHKEPGFAGWGESFGDQVAMWTQLQEPSFRKALIENSPNGIVDFSKTNMLSQLAEAIIPVQGEPIRDALNTAKLGQLSEEVHDSSIAMTGATYEVFSDVYAKRIANGASQDTALQEAGALMGKLLFRTAEHTPEDFIRYTDIAKGMLTADEIHFGGAHRDILESVLKQRGFLDSSDLTQLRIERKNIAAFPPVSLNGDEATDKEAIAKYIDTTVASLPKILGPNPDKRHNFSLRLGEVVKDNQGNRVVRFGLNHTFGGQTREIGNNGSIVIDKNGKVLDLQSPRLPHGRVETLALADKKLKRLYALEETARFESGNLGSNERVEGTPVFQISLVPAPGEDGFEPALFYTALNPLTQRPIAKVQTLSNLEAGKRAETVELPGTEAGHFLSHN